VRRLLAGALLGALSLGAPSAAQPTEPRALLFLIDDVPYHRAASDRTVADLARAGGLALMTTVGGDQEGAEAREAIVGPLRAAGALKDARLEVAEAAPGSSLAEFGDEVAAAISRQQAGDLLVMWVVPSASPAMRARGEIVTPVVMARGTPSELTGSSGPPRGLSSPTTRRTGLVSNADVAATVLDHLGLPTDAALGAPVRPAGEPPTALLRRFLQYRRVVTPVGTAVLGAAVGALVMALVLLFARGTASSLLARVVAVGGLGAVALQAALLPGSVLPAYHWPLVAGVVVTVGVALTALALRWGRGPPAPVAPVAVVAGSGLGLVLADAALGWPALLTPLMGGSALEGVRFYGLGNSYAGLVLAGSVLAAALLRPWAGVTLIVAAAMFAGLPWFGADLGGGITLAAAAALWWAFRVRGRLGWREIVVVAASALAAVAVIVLAHRVEGGPTHVTRAVASGDGLVPTFGRRLLINLRTTAATPAVWPALAAIPVWLWVAWRRAGPFRVVLERQPAWRDAVVVLAVGAMIGYVANDTYGTAAVSAVYLSAALVYPALRQRWTND
jgi:hypothetical protein